MKNKESTPTQERFLTNRTLVDKEIIRNKENSRNVLRWNMGLLICLVVPFLFFLFSVVTLVPVLISNPDVDIAQQTTEEVVSGINIGTLLLSTIVAELAIVSSYVFFAKRNIRINAKELLGFQNFNPKHVGLSALLGVALFLGLQLVATLVGKIFSEPITSSDTSTNVTSGTGILGAIALFFIVPILAPFVEEMLFRGVVLNGLSLGGMKNITAIIISSFFFSIVHFQGFSTPTDVFILIWIGFMAICQAVIFLKTKSIYNTIAIHIAYNSITVIVPLILS